MLSGAGIAAAVLVGVSLSPVLRSALGLTTDASVAQTDVAGAFFRDFETYLFKDRADDVMETNLARIAQWYSSRLPFSLPPVSASGAGANLVGGRLCWLLNRRLASLSYQSERGPIVLYITQISGISLPDNSQINSFAHKVSWYQSGSNSSLIWQSGDLLMALVGTQEVRRLMAVAQSIAG